MRTLLEFYTATQVAGLPLNMVTYGLLLAGCWTYALWQGGAPERTGATIMVASFIPSAATVSSPVVSFEFLETGVLTIDVLCLAAVVALAIRAERFWPLWVAALQLLTVAAHGVKLVEPDMLRRAYAFLIVVWSYPMIAIIIAGTARHAARLRNFGSDASWSPLQK